MHRFVKFISLLITTMALVGCYHSNPNGKVLPSTASSSTQTHEVAGYNLDSVSEMQNFNYEFYKTHHYAQATTRGDAEQYGNRLICNKEEFAHRGG